MKVCYGKYHSKTRVPSVNGKYHSKMSYGTKYSLKGTYGKYHSKMKVPKLNCKYHCKNKVLKASGKYHSKMKVPVALQRGGTVMNERYI